MRSILPIAAVLLSVGCAMRPPGPSADLPPDAVQGAGDPTRGAISQSSYVFANPAQFAGRPGDVARAVANLEFLAVSLPVDPRFSLISGGISGQLVAGRDEARRGLGIAGTAPPQPVIDGLYAASRALRAGDRASAERALASPSFGAGGPETLRRLEAAQRLPIASAATNRAAEEMSTTRTDRAIR